MFLKILISTTAFRGKFLIVLEILSQTTVFKLNEFICTSSGCQFNSVYYCLKFMQVFTESTFYFIF